MCGLYDLYGRVRPLWPGLTGALSNGFAWTLGKEKQQIKTEMLKQSDPIFEILGS